MTDAYDVLTKQFSETESTMSGMNENAELSVRRRLLEGNLQDPLPTLRSRAVRIYISSSFPGKLSFVLIL